MPSWSITTRGEQPVTVEAENWILAMGSGIAALYDPDRLERLACEMLQNGTVLARDVQSGQTFIIRPIEDEVDPLEEETERFDDFNGDEVFALGPAPEDEITEVESRDLERMEAGLRAILAAEVADEAWAAGLKACRDQIVSEAGAGVAGGPGEELVFLSTAGRAARMLLGLRLPASTGFVGLCVDRRVCLIINEVDRDPRHYRGVDDLTGAQTRAVLCAPVAAGERTYGCLELINPPDRFTRSDLATIEAIGDAVGARLAALDGALDADP